MAKKAHDQSYSSTTRMIIRNASDKYRPDIDGLRAVAVLAVVVHHAFPRLAPGGFVGVDIFFVISGYLISQILLAEFSSGRFTFTGFYYRRLKRLFPALATVLLVISLASWYVLFQSELESYGKHLLASVTFAINVLLWRETGYFESAIALKPLAHLWSLAVEEQYYLLWPLLLWLCWPRLPLLGRIVLGLALFSMITNLAGAQYFPRANFFLLPSRLWEFVLGCSLCWVGPPDLRSDMRSGWESKFGNWLAWTRASGRTADFTAVAGISLIVASIVFLHPGWQYPGWQALLPTLGTFIVIAVGPYSKASELLLQHPLVLYVGRISYPLYLWHWPLLVLGRIVAPQMGLTVKVGLILLAFSLAALTYHFIECPLRFWGGGRRLVVVPLVSVMGGLGVWGILMATKVSTPRLAYATKQINEAHNDWEYPDNGGKLDKINLGISQIAGDASKGILLIGDSHMKQYWARFKYLNDRDPQRGAVTFAPMDIPPLPNINRVSDGSASHSHRLFEKAIALANQPGIKSVVFAGYWEAYIIGHYGFRERWGENNYVSDLYDFRDPNKTPLMLGSSGLEQIFAEFKALVGGLIHQGKRVTIILSNPTSPVFEPGSIVANRLSPRVEFGVNYSISAQAFDEFTAPISKLLRQIAVETGAQIIDPLPYLSVKGMCPATVNGVPIYKDDNHLRSSYVRRHMIFIDSLYVE